MNVEGRYVPQRGELPPNPLDLAYWILEEVPPRWEPDDFIADFKAWLSLNDPWENTNEAQST